MRRKILNKHFRLNPSAVLFFLLLAVSIMCMPACSSDSDNAAVQPNYIVQATVSFEEDGPVAYALVMDGGENLVDTLTLNINGEPMSIEYWIDSNWVNTETVDVSPYYTMDLPDLSGGDMVVFEARDQFGAIIYAPEPAVIPMAIELLEPEEGHEIMAGDEVMIRWTGGEGAEVFSAAYAALDGSALYFDYLEPSESGAYTVPAGQTVEGEAIVGVGAISGETSVIGTMDSDFSTNASYFLVSRESGISVNVMVEEDIPYARNTSSEGCPRVEEKNRNGECIAQFAALGIGAIVWETRRQLEYKEHPETKRCGAEGTARDADNGAMKYCTEYAYGHGFRWLTGCISCITPVVKRCHEGYDWGRPVTTCRCETYYAEKPRPYWTTGCMTEKYLCYGCCGAYVYCAERR